MGQKAGIHPRESIERLEQKDKNVDQHARNRVAKKAKDYYHRNYSLSKEYSESVRQTKIKDSRKSIGKG